MQDIIKYGKIVKDKKPNKNPANPIRPKLVESLKCVVWTPL